MPKDKGKDWLLVIKRRGVDGRDSERSDEWSRKDKVWILPLPNAERLHLYNNFLLRLAGQKSAETIQKKGTDSSEQREVVAYNIECKGKEGR